LEENKFPLAPMVLGIVLGKLVEQHLMQSLISTQGSIVGLFERPMAGILGAITLAVWLFPFVRWVWNRARG
ncbi:MAG TPA: C4-dicarboxylate ABC transporter permease, partial [Hyphomicrobiaceae bacterium]